MNPSLASLIFACGIAGLFYLDRDDSIHTSKALWLPVIWMWIIGSRPVSAWLGVTPSSGTNVQLDGSPLDAVVFGVLLAAAVTVLIGRGKRTRAFLASNWPILIYFLYCLVSVLWSDHSAVAFKRWIKATGDLAMILVIVTDGEPVNAIRRVLSRTGFLLLPTSVLFIKYYDYLGRGYTPDGGQCNTGVTTNKNTLGVIVLILSLGALWRVLALLRDKNQSGYRRRLMAQSVLLAFGVVLFGMADSATSLSCFILGSLLMIAAELPVIRRQPGLIHAVVAIIVATAGLMMIFGGQAEVVHALGRQTNLTGRTEIWAAVIPAVPNSLIGAGFESFWIGPDVQKVWHSLSGWLGVEGLNEAHNGYIEVYLNLGLVGVFLVSLILIGGYRRAARLIRTEPATGALMLAYIITAAVHNITEAEFRMLDPMWIFLLLAVVASSRGGASLAHDQVAKPASIPSRSMMTSRDLLKARYRLRPPERIR
jgi:exopolysaccharide production protein ExoQ